MTGSAPKVVLSYGLGVDSTAVLLRWIHEPDTRPFDTFADLLVLTAHTGDEFAQTAGDVTDHVLPLMRDQGIRFAQVARTSGSQTDGVTVLSDTHTPDTVHVDGAYKLSDELRAAGTIAQRGGARRCSLKSKGNPLDVTLGIEVQGQEFVHVIGFEANELARARRDIAVATDLPRVPSYPLIEWGWDRQTAIDFIHTHTGIVWAKSACLACPFSWGAKDSRIMQIARFENSPGEAAAAMMQEYLAYSLNPNQTLDVNGPLWGIVGPQALAAFHDQLAITPHSLYEVRRVLRPRTDDPTKVANAARSVRVLDTGSRTGMLTALSERTGQFHDPADLVHQHWITERGVTLPTTEHLLAVAPTGAVDKQHPKFEQWWAATGDLALLAS